MVVRHVVIDQTWFNQIFNQMVVHIPLREYHRIPPTLQIIHDTCGGTQGDDAEAANRQDTSTERRTSHGKYLLGFQQLPAAAKLPNSARVVEVAALLGLLADQRREGRKEQRARESLSLPSSDCFSPPAVSFGMRRAAGLLLIQSSPFSDSCTRFEFDVLGIYKHRNDDVIWHCRGL